MLLSDTLQIWWAANSCIELDPIAIIVLSVAQMFVTSAWELVLLRFLIGIAVGADYPISTSLVAEFSPKKYRGFMLGFLISMWYVGAVAAAIVGYALVVRRPGRMEMDVGQRSLAGAPVSVWTVEYARVSALVDEQRAPRKGPGNR